MRQLPPLAERAAKILCCFIFASLLFAFLPAVNAQAAGWPQEVSEAEPGELLTNIDGSVNAVCPEKRFGPEAKIFSLGGEPIGTIPAATGGESLTFCKPQSVTDVNGVLYGIRSPNDIYDNHNKIVAYKGDTELWSKPVVDVNPCGGKLRDDHRVYELTLGTDGYLYAYVKSSGCGANFLAKVHPADGTTVFITNLGREDVKISFGCNSRARELHYPELTSEQIDELSR